MLIRLARSPGSQLRMTDLAAQTSLSTSGVTRVVDRMERDGLVDPPGLPDRPAQLVRRGHRRRRGNDCTRSCPGTSR